MLRLLQGDVGPARRSWRCSLPLRSREVGKQAALMAPTEILARQHIKTIAPLAERAACAWRILTGREKGKERREIFDAAGSREIDFLSAPMR